MANIYLELLQDPLSLVFVFLASLALILLQSKSPSPPLPPGPKPLPIIGNMLMMHQLTHCGLAALAEKHGGLVHLRLGHVHAFAVSTPEHAREVLQAQDLAFANRPATAAVAYLTYGRADMAFAHYGPFWRKARRLSSTKLFSRRRTETWLAMRDECAALIRAVATRSSSGAGEGVNVGELIFDLTKNAIYRAAFGTRDGERQAEFIAILQEFSQLLDAFNVGDFIPWLSWIDPRGINRRLRVARAALDRFIDKIIDEHIKRGKSPDDAGSDMVDEMLAYLAADELNTTDGTCKDSAGGGDDQENILRLTRNNIKGIIMDMMFGGTETVASGIECAMVEMVRSPDELRRLQQELADVVGLDRNVDESDLSNLPFLKCVVKETLRLHPPIPLLLHETATDCVLGGYSVPKGSRVMVNVWALGRDRATWKDADVFRPSRFAPGGEAAGLDVKGGGSFEYIPYGSGRRACPGMALGQYALELAVAQLAHGFDWALPEGVEASELDMADVFGLAAPRASRFRAVATPRLTCPLY